MNPHTIRYIDKNIGAFLCFLLSVCRGFARFFNKDTSRLKETSKILFIKLLEQGSIVLACPAIKKAEARFGRDDLFFLTFKKTRPILDVLDIVPAENIIEIDSRNLGSVVFSSLAALRRIRHAKIDATVDLEFFTRATAILSYLSGVKTRVGFHRINQQAPYIGNLYTHNLMYNPHMHTKSAFLSLVKALDYPPTKGIEPLKFQIPDSQEGVQFIPSEEEKQQLIAKIEQIKSAPLSQPLIVLNPNTDDLLPIRRWPNENFIQLADMVLKDFPQATIVVTGTERGRQEAETLASSIKNSICLAGKTTLRELLTLYFIGDWLITSDSGPAHFASLTQIKTIVLFGPEVPALYGNENERIKVLHRDLVCSPCVNIYNQRDTVCKSAVCLKSITPTEVYREISTCLQPVQV